VKIVEEAVCISSAEADTVIRAELEKLGESRFSLARGPPNHWTDDSTT